MRIHPEQYVVVGKSSRKPIPSLFDLRSSKMFITLSVCCAVFTDIFLYALIVSVLPFSLSNDQGVTTDDDGIAEWTAVLLTAYSVGLFVASPVAGWYADRSESRQKPFLISIVLLSVSTVLLCFAPGVELLIIARVGQGASAGIVWSVGLALIADLYGRDVGKVMGLTEVSVSLGQVSAPVLGGALYDSFGYYAVYSVAFFVLFIDIVLRVLLIEPAEAELWRQRTKEAELMQAMKTVDWTEEMEDDALKLGEKDTTLPLAAQKYEPISPLASSPTSAGYPPAELTWAVSVVAKRRSHPALVLLRYPRVLAALAGVAVESATMSSLDAVLPVYVKSAFSWTSLQAGLLFLAIYLPGFCDPLIGWLSDSFGARWSALAGFAFAVPVWLSFQVLPSAAGTVTPEYHALLIVLLSLIGITLSLASLPLMAEISYAIKEKAAADPGVWGSRGARGVTALSYGLFCMAFAVGGVLGSMVGGYIYALMGWNAFCISMAAVCGGGAGVVAIWTPSKGPSFEDDDEEAPGGHGEDDGDELKQPLL
ncbi:MFS general substrate transporter [Thozetella sp. PMI_491]|nr:MFS general substrate transporter [Thozetella sp. PMI_491]